MAELQRGLEGVIAAENENKFNYRKSIDLCRL